MVKHKFNLEIEFEIQDGLNNEVFTVEYEEEKLENLVTKEVKRIMVDDVELIDVGKFKSGYRQLVFQKSYKENDKED